jgi:hypothetical protein
MKRAILLISIVLPPLLGGACSGDPAKGYTTARPFRDDIRTIAVPMFTRSKEVYRRDVEIRLTEAIQKRITQNTPYRLAKRENADSELTGELVLIDQQVLAYNPDNGVPREIEAVFTINFTWKDRRGNVLVKRTNFQVSDTYIPAAPFNEDFFQGSEAVIDKIARLVVEQMESEW